MEQQEYPKTMVHPHHRPAEVKHEMERLGGSSIKAALEVLPQIIVYDAEQEAENRSRGYVVPSETTGMLQADLILASYVPKEYPKYVNGQIVQNAEEERALRGEPEPAAEEKEPASLKQIVAEYRASGYSWADVAADLNQSGITHPVTGKPWTTQTIGGWYAKAT